MVIPRIWSQSQRLEDRNHKERHPSKWFQTSKRNLQDNFVNEVSGVKSLPSKVAKSGQEQKSSRQEQIQRQEDKTQVSDINIIYRVL